MKHYWLSSSKMTVGVGTDKGFLVYGPPIVRKFMGQPIVNLVNWLKKQGSFRYYYYGKTPDVPHGRL